jgi:hypothetical protein
MSFHGSQGTPEAELRVDQALELIERAQHDLERACAELSAIVGAVPLWERTSKVAQKAHDLWRALAYRDRRRWRLDDVHRKAIAAARAASDAADDGTEKGGPC